MKRHLLLIAALLLGTMLTSCFKDHPDTSQEGLYVGIIGFNSELHTKTLKILNDATKDDMKNFVNGLTMQNGTVLCHAVNTALDKIEKITPPEDLINVSIITFTDGLDEGSIMLNSNFNSSDEYLSYVSNRIRNSFIGDNNIPISAYAIGVKGSDVVNETSFNRDLEKLSSDPRHNVFLLDNMSQVSQTFANIAQDLYHQSSSWDVTLKAPAPNPGTRIRFTFDNVNTAEESQKYIEGTYSVENGTKIFGNIEYVGLEDCGDVVYPTVEGIFLVFTFSNLYTTDGNPVYTTNTKEWKWDNTMEMWVKNSEFTPSGNTVSHEEFKSALIMLVLDCSSSLGNDFTNMQSAACQFIETLNGSTHQ